MGSRRILIVVSGGIAAYKAPELVRALRRAGHEVRCVLTRAAGEFVSALALQTVSGHRVRSELLDAAANAHVQIEGVSSDFPALKDSVAAAAAARAEAASAAAAGKRVASPGGPAGAAEDDEGKDKASKPKWLRM